MTSTVTIADGASLSDALALNGMHLVGIVLPSGWDSAKVSFAVSTATDGTFVPAFDATGELQFPATSGVASQALCIAAGTFAGWAAIKVRSGLVAAATNQSGAVVLTCVLMAYD